jgi:hypothetical protein
MCIKSTRYEWKICDGNYPSPGGRNEESGPMADCGWGGGMLEKREGASRLDAPSIFII